MDRPNGVSTAYSYDLAGRLVGVDHVGPDGPVAGFDYTLDEAGNRVGVNTLDGSESYVLDELNRLTSATYLDGTSEAFSYDPAGNRLTHTGPEGTTTYTYGPTGELDSLDGPDGQTTFIYDELGQLTATSDGDSYSYDTAGRLTTATVDGVTQSFGYDADGVRVDVDGQTQLWDRTSGLPNLIDDGTTHIHAPGGLLASGDEWALADALGSVRGLTDPTGELTASVDYRAFGEPTSGWDGFGFTGGIHDPTGQIHFRARNLDPGLGRFTTRDPIQPGAPGTGGYNHYTYVANNPTTWTDPTGQSALIDYLYVQSVRLSVWTAASPIGVCASGAFVNVAEGIAMAGANLPGASQDALFGCILNRIENPNRPRGGGGSGGGGAGGGGGGSSSGPDIPNNRPRLPQDKSVDPMPPALKETTNRSIGRPSHDEKVQEIIKALPDNATDVRLNQQQVNADGERVGTNRPDLQYTVDEQRYYVEIEGLGNPRGDEHRERILANDPAGEFELLKVP